MQHMRQILIFIHVVYLDTLSTQGKIKNCSNKSCFSEVIRDTPVESRGEYGIYMGIFFLNFLDTPMQRKSGFGGWKYFSPENFQAP